ncbi:MAG: HAD-IC family P-type ATPase, partial [Flavipsychrobacter sp.]|nr:HAD-IC family P-type ATPase [Flavipsychrobacter sp.]
ISFILSLPVFFYSASEFYISAWKGLRQRMLNIDAPIVLALVITFSRSIYEIATGTGSGFLDSMSGIVFFMLVGRIVQERTYRSLSFHRDYKAYFPIAVSVVTTEGVVSKTLHDLKEKDVVRLYNEEIIPADAIVVKGRAKIDYSFVTGESEPVTIAEGEMVYAGGKQVGEQLTIQVVKPVAGSYLTSLWNHYSFSGSKEQRNMDNSIIHKLSRYFTYILLTLAAITAVYWGFNDTAKILPSVSAMLIVACPCALLLSATYTNGNLLRIFSNNGLFLRDASVIEQLGNAGHLVFDKTGTLTQGATAVQVYGGELTDEEQDMVYNVVRSSRHPYSKALANYLGVRPLKEVTSWREAEGRGLEAYIGIDKIWIGSAPHVGVTLPEEGVQVYARINNKIAGFHIVPEFRTHMEEVMAELKQQYGLSLLSGDNDIQRPELQQLLGIGSQLHFDQKPEDKLRHIEQWQHEGRKVLMIGDGLNDAGALRQSNVGITLADDINNFTPACDAILDARRFASFPSLLKLAKAGRSVINFSFVVSILYNIVGLFISMQGLMSPMIAAILMPVSTLSIVLITTGASSLAARRWGLSLAKREQ